MLASEVLVFLAKFVMVFEITYSGFSITNLLMSCSLEVKLDSNDFIFNNTADCMSSPRFFPHYINKTKY